MPDTPCSLSPENCSRSTSSESTSGDVATRSGSPLKQVHLTSSKDCVYKGKERGGRPKNEQTPLVVFLIVLEMENERMLCIENRLNPYNFFVLNTGEGCKWPVIGVYDAARVEKHAADCDLVPENLNERIK